MRAGRRAHEWLPACSSKLDQLISLTGPTPKKALRAPAALALAPHPAAAPGSRSTRQPSRDGFDHWITSMTNAVHEPIRGSTPMQNLV
jgi:hypothetical protein